MNYYYIDYMIKERLNDEIADCERKRLLHSCQDGYWQKSTSWSYSFLMLLKNLRTFLKEHTPHRSRFVTGINSLLQH
ncbi:MAG: hypothetical protein D6B25_09730 [Desulfobulbaceae bacterium]|nr:MAG: hypothetical protein D6B25_09730 [Desulfobulbaceae bacterium]